MQKKLNASITIIALAILGYFAYTLWAGLDETVAAMLRLGWLGAAVVLGLSLINYALRFVRWQWYLHSMTPQNLSWGRSLRYYVAGFTFTATPGKAGEMVRSLFLKHHNVTYTQSVAMFFVERLSDLIAILLMALLILWQFEGYGYWMLVAAGLIISVLLLLRHADSWQALLQQLSSRLPTIISQSLNHIAELVSHSRSLLHAQFLFGGLALSLLSWGAEGLGFYYICAALELDVSIYIAIGIYATSLIVGALSFLPGGLGSTEAVMLILLTTIGVSHEEALAVTLICRIATLWFAVILGAFAMLGLKINPLDTENDAAKTTA